LNEDGKTLW